MNLIFPAALETAVDQSIELLEQTPFLPGQLFYTGAELQQKLNISPALAKDVLRQLVEVGRIEPTPGGNLVSHGKIVRNTWSMSSLSEAMSSRHLAFHSQVLSFAVVEAPKTVFKALNLTLGEKVYCLHRLRYVENRPLIVELSYLPVSRFPNLLAYDFAQNSLYHILDEQYHLRAENQSLEFFIEKPTPDEAAWLQLEPNDTLLTLSGETFNQNGNVFEYSISKSAGRYTCYECSPILEGLF
ncbi:MAG: GntR family transcriptional regulator [Ruthenibacterium sp.]